MSAKTQDTTKVTQVGFNLSLASSLPSGEGAYPIAYSDDIWDIAEPDTGLSKVIKATGQYDQHTINEALAANKADLENGKVPASQLPGYVDDVKEYENERAFPQVGDENPPTDDILYVSKATNKTYRWSGTQYTQVGGDTTLEVIYEASEWTFTASPMSAGASANNLRAVFDEDIGKWVIWGDVPDEIGGYMPGSGGSTNESNRNATTLTSTITGPMGAVEISATRTVSTIPTAYILNGQTKKPLQPAGDYVRGPVDQRPRFGSTNVVSSDAVYTYVDAAGSFVLPKSIELRPVGGSASLTVLDTLIPLEVPGKLISGEFIESALVESRVVSYQELVDIARDEGQCLFAVPASHGQMRLFRMFIDAETGQEVAEEADEQISLLGWQDDPTVTLHGVTYRVSAYVTAVVRQSDIVESVKPMVNTTYASLKALRDDSELVPGQEYRIVDYEATVANDDNARAVSHPFDIIVVADAVNKFNEKARAVQHDGDTYFNGCKLEAWQIWYCIDNDTNRFAWADTTNGKGVIYRMIDEWNNDVPYDFKGIQFKAYGDTDDVWRYTFDNGGVSDNIDQSLTGGLTFVMSGRTYEVGIYGNIIKPYRTLGTVKLNRIVFKGWGCFNNSFGVDCYSNSFAGHSFCNSFGRTCYNNVFGYQGIGNSFGNDCHDNSFDHDCYYNSFKAKCYNNSFDDNCSYNSFGRDCHNNTFDGNYSQNNSFGNGCSNNSFGYQYCYNSFGIDCSNNSFGCTSDHNFFGNGCSNNSFGDFCDNNFLKAYCYNNSFGNGCGHNTFGSNCYNNSFGGYCSSNVFGNAFINNLFEGDYCSGNFFGNTCNNNSFGARCSSNSFGNSCNHIIFGTSDSTKDYCRCITVESGNQYLYLTPTGTTSSSTYYQNVTIAAGVNQTKTYKEITDSNVGQTFKTTYQPASSQVISI